MKSALSGFCVLCEPKALGKSVTFLPKFSFLWRSQPQESADSWILMKEWELWILYTFDKHLHFDNLILLNTMCDIFICFGCCLVTFGIKFEFSNEFSHDCVLANMIWNISLQICGLNYLHTEKTWLITSIHKSCVEYNGLSPVMCWN